jgi:hypothetical protein
MLDTDFLRSLGIREELLPPGEGSREVASAINEQDLPRAGEKGVPPELLELNDQDLEKFLKERCTQDNPYVFLLGNGITKVAIYPYSTLGRYDLYDFEYTTDRFVNFVSYIKQYGLSPPRSLRSPGSMRISFYDAKRLWRIIKEAINGSHLLCDRENYHKDD